MIVKNARIGEYQSKKNLSVVSSTQIILDNIPQDDPRIQELLKWREETEISEGDLKNNHGGSEKDKSYRTLAQIESDTEHMTVDKMFFDLRASVAHIKTEGSLYYLACSNGDKCMKKVTEDNGEYKCESCGTTSQNPNPRYTLSVNLVDASGSLWISCFDKIGEALVGKSAKELKQYRDAQEEAQVVEILKEITSQEYFFKIMSKVDTYNGDRKIKHQAVRVNPMSYVNESKEILKMLEQYNQVGAV